MTQSFMPSKVVFTEWHLTDDLENIIAESLSLLDQIDEAIKTAGTI